MDKMCRMIVVAIFLSLACSCGPHAVMQAVPRYDIAANPSATRRPAHNRKVFITRQTVDPASIEELGIVDVTKAWYGSKSSVLESMADMARQMGADAVIEAEVWFKAIGWSWGITSGQGKGCCCSSRSDRGFLADTRRVPMSRIG